MDGRGPAPSRKEAKDAAAKDAAEDGDATLWELPAYSPRKSVSRSAKPRGTAPEKGAKGAQH